MTIAALSSPIEGARSFVIPLDTVAAVQAAVAEGFELREVLATEGLANEAFNAAKLHWTTIMAREPEGPAFKEYRAHLARAEDRLHRPVTPLDKEVGAWLAFLEAVKMSPQGELTRWSLGPNDLARLERSWSKKWEDPAIKNEAAELKKRGLPPLSNVRVGPKVLRPSIGNAGDAANDAAPSASSNATIAECPELIGLAEYAAIMAELSVQGIDLNQWVRVNPSGLRTTPGIRTALERYNLSVEDLCAQHHRWLSRFSTDPALLRDYQMLFAHQRQRWSLQRPSASSGAALRAEHHGTPASSPPASHMKPPPESEAVVSHGRARPAMTIVSNGRPTGPALPFAPARPEPALTLEQHATLTVEMTYAPQWKVEILRRYGITPMEKERLDQCYLLTLVQKDAQAHARWSAAYRTYAAEWIRRHRQSTG